jgi:Rps23 Pro-64 3,4-dihydroxylase Tpa1-like proline 4-hydroxylase
MINFDKLEAERARLTQEYANAEPFPLVIIDDFCEPERLAELTRQIPKPEEAGIAKSRDYVFAKNKFEKSTFRELGPLFEEVYADITSDRFKVLLQEIVGSPVWVDPEFHGGGIHQGGKDSFLDMHVDFSHHPMHDDWKRELNILLYLNPGWEPAHGGSLKLRNLETDKATQVEPLFNRCVIMETSDRTLHGYPKINFPDGTYRRSIATYAYSKALEPATGRSTIWYPEEGSAVKRALGQAWPKLVAIKSRVFGSATSRNR